jgi:hypothetical protein
VEKEATNFSKNCPKRKLAQFVGENSSNLVTHEGTQSTQKQLQSIVAVLPSLPLSASFCLGVCIELLEQLEID